MNEMLITQRVVNCWLADTLVALVCKVQAAYESDVPAVRSSLEAAAAAMLRVVAEPAPAYHLDAFGADGIDLSVNFWIRDPENGQGNVRSEVNPAILDALNAAGVSIPFPQRVVHSRMAAVS